MPLLIVTCTVCSLISSTPPKPPSAINKPAAREEAAHISEETTKMRTRPPILGIRRLSFFISSEPLQFPCHEFEVGSQMPLPKWIGSNNEPASIQSKRSFPGHKMIGTIQ